MAWIRNMAIEKKQENLHAASCDLIGIILVVAAFVALRLKVNIL
jgi:hypothetical protein